MFWGRLVGDLMGVLAIAHMVAHGFCMQGLLCPTYPNIKRLWPRPNNLHPLHIPVGHPHPTTG